MTNGDVKDNRDGGTSRRSALKLGVGAGVGLAAWSGASITSLGGTPAYALGCTFVVKIDLLACRNTDRGNCPKPTPQTQVGLHPLKSSGFPPGYSLTNNVSNGTCCTANHKPVLNFPSGITCAVTVLFALPDNCQGTQIASYTDGPSSTGSLQFTLKCPGPSIPSQTQYSVVAKCNTTGAPTSCLT